MTRILFFVFVVFLVWLLLRLARGRGAGSPEAGTPVATTTPAEPIAQCAWCGVHVPAGSAVALPDGRVYCGATHRDRALNAGDAS